jgi:limonene-1,2-epoxide hydrolase
LRLLLALGVVVTVAAAGCGSNSPSPESVVRAWSAAVNAGDNDGAAHLFAKGAEVVQAGTIRKLKNFDDALAWNSALPCSGRIVSIRSRGDTARATFLLGDRKSSRCDGPGQRATAIFRIRNGKIVLWHQTATVPGPPPPSV